MKAQPWQLDINAYAYRYSISPLYSHLDVQRHVNNVAAQSFHTEARIRFLIDALDSQAWFSDTVLLRPRRTVTSFLHETHYLHEVQCTVNLMALDENQFALALALFQQDRCVGVQYCVLGAWEKDRWVALPGVVTDVLAPRLTTDLSPVAVPELDADLPQLQRFPCHAEVVARFADFDPDRRFGELAVARCLEQARAGSLSILPMPGHGLLVARIDIRYDRWQKGMGQVRLPCALASIGNSSFVLRGGVLVSDSLVAASESVMVLIDRSEHRPTAIPAELRSRMETFLMS